MLANVNDSLTDAKQLGQLLSGARVRNYRDALRFDTSALQGLCV